MQMQPIAGSQIPTQSSASQSMPNPQPTTTGYGVAALVCGILSLFIPIIGFFFAIAAIILFFVQKSKGGTTGIAIAGLVTGIIGLLTLPLMFLGAMSYFGVLDPSELLPDKCLFGAGIGACQEFAIQGDDIKFILINNLGAEATISKISGSITGITTPCSPTLSAEQMQWSPSSINRITASGCKIKTEERPTLVVTIEYKLKDQTYTKSVDGVVSVKKN